jgi:hypothetical protein
MRQVLRSAMIRTLLNLRNLRLFAGSGLVIAILGVGHDAMDSRHKERWMELCERASVERDSAKLIELTEQIIQILEEREERLKTIESFLGKSGERSQPSLPPSITKS